MKGYWTEVRCDICKNYICRFLSAWDSVKIPTICKVCWKDTYPEVIESP
jgi:hypothetical protein